MQILKKEKRMMEVDVTIENYFLCDKCNQKINHENYNAFDFQLKHRTGTNYPSGGAGDEISMDLCEACADEFIQLIRTNEYRTSESHWDY